MYIVRNIYTNSTNIFRCRNKIIRDIDKLLHVHRRQFEYVINNKNYCSFVETIHK